MYTHTHTHTYIYIYIGFKTFFYVVRHLASIASYLPTGLHLGFFRSWPSLYLPSGFSTAFMQREISNVLKCNHSLKEKTRNEDYNRTLKTAVIPVPSHDKKSLRAIVTHRHTVLQQIKKKLVQFSIDQQASMRRF